MKRKNLTNLTLSLATLLTLTATTVSAENLIQNGSFENMASVLNEKPNYKEGQLSSWTGEVRVVTDRIGKKSREGNYKLLLDSQKNRVEKLSQTLNLEEGREYRLSLEAYGSNLKSSFIEILLDDEVIRTIKPTRKWKRYSLKFRAKSATSTLTFQEKASQDDKKGAMIDDVQLILIKDITVPTESNRTIQLVQGEEYSLKIPSSKKGKFFLRNAPDGMSINERTGELTWTPIAVKTVVVEVIKPNKEHENIKFEVQEGNFNIDKNWIFVSANGDNSNSGTYDSPYANLKKLCGKGKVLEGKKIFYRGGVYKNENFGLDTNTHPSLPTLTCSGTKKSQLVVSPWKNEHAKIKFDSAYGVKISANYVTFENFEIEGIAQDIDYDDVINHWWDASNYYNGQGLNISGHDLIIRNNVIHDVPGAGINNLGNTLVDRVQIDNNIIFNASWWSLGGTTALGIVGANGNSKLKKLDSKKGIEITNNLIFASESRIFSHVFSKGMSHLIIDEGSSMLLKKDKGSKVGTYNKGFLVSNNFFLFNGKGVSLRWDKIEMSNNTFYNNGTTMKGSGGGIRSSQGTNMVLTNNAIYSDVNENLNAIDFEEEKVSVKICSNNLYYTPSNRMLKNPQICAVGTEADNKVDADMFTDASNNDFMVSSNRKIGASMESLNIHKERLKKLGYELKPANYKRTINGVKYAVNTPEYYDAQISKIIELAKAYTNAVIGYNPIYKKKEVNGYTVEFTKANRPKGVEVDSYVLKVNMW